MLRITGNQKMKSNLRCHFFFLLGWKNNRDIQKLNVQKQKYLNINQCIWFMQCQIQYEEVEFSAFREDNICSHVGKEISAM